nr:NADH dehydrogenase subunit 1 [Halipeurus diversus]
MLFIDFFTLLQMLILIVMVMTSVAFFSLFERKMMSLIQLRKGPNKVSFYGILQPISDAIKLMTKEDSSPDNSSKIVYSISPVLFMLISLLIWLTIPTSWNIFYIDSSILLIILCFSLSVYGLIALGWFSNSKYAMLGSMRSISQSISYEIVLSFSIFSFMIYCMTLNLKNVSGMQEYIWNVLPFMSVSIITMISMLAEGNRSPFDLSEGESELVSGYCVEYGCTSYTLIFLSENVYLMYMSFVFSSLFLGINFMFMKISLMVVLFVWIRATMPRMRFDKIMMLCWLVLMPIILCVVMLYVLFV